MRFCMHAPTLLRWATTRVQGMATARFRRGFRTACSAVTVSDAARSLSSSKVCGGVKGCAHATAPVLPDQGHVQQVTLAPPSDAAQSRLHSAHAYQGCTSLQTPFRVVPTLPVLGPTVQACRWIPLPTHSTPALPTASGCAVLWTRPSSCWCHPPHSTSCKSVRAALVLVAAAACQLARSWALLWAQQREQWRQQACCGGAWGRDGGSAAAVRAWLRS